MNNLDGPLNPALTREIPAGSDSNQAAQLVDRSSPDTRAIFQKNGDQGLSSLSNSGQILFNTADIYGGGDKNSGAGLQGSAESKNGLGSSAAVSTTVATATAEAVPAAVPALESDSAQVSAGSERPSVSTTPADLTPAKEAIAQSTVKLTTPIYDVDTNGQIAASTAGGTGFLFTGADGQQYIGTAGHTVAAIGKDPLDGHVSYTEGRTQVTLPDGT